MKKIILISLLFAAIGSQAQTFTKVKSKSAAADSIWLIKGGKEIAGIVISARGDTARSVDYVLSENRDTTGQATISIRYWNKYGTQLYSLPSSVPSNGFTHWSLLLSKIDAWVLANIPRLTFL